MVVYVYKIMSDSPGNINVPYMSMLIDILGKTASNIAGTFFQFDKLVNNNCHLVFII